MEIRDLTPAERRVWRAFPRGRRVDFTDRPPGPERTVRAKVLRALLLTQGAADGEVASLRMTAARITGRLDLKYATVEHPVSLHGCHFDEVPFLYGARVRQFNLQGSHLPGLDAATIHVDGVLRVTGCRVTGLARLGGARISGALFCDGAEFGSPGVATALELNHVSVGRDLYGVGLAAHGTVRLNGAEVTGKVNLRDAVLDAPGGTALNAKLLTVGSNVSLDELQAQGEVRLHGARIPGQLGLTGARLSEPGGTALDVGAVVIGSGADLTGLQAEGRIELHDATVTGPLDLSRARLTAPGGVVLDATSLTVGSNVVLHRLQAEGRVELRGATISGQLNCAGARFTNPGETALRASSCTIGELWLREDSLIEGAVNLRRSQIDMVHAEPGAWPDVVKLDGFVYTALNPRRPARERLPLLERDDDGYVPFAYEQLAASYRRIGDEAGVRAVQLARQRRHRGTLPWYARIWGYLQEVTVGYGFKPLRAAAWLVALLAAGTAAFGLHHPPPLKPDETPGFNALFYTLDLLLPIIDFGQEKAFKPQGGYQWLSYALILAGWVLATTIITGITRALSRQ
ncbi:translocation/assembly module TamB domain-containing protein [Actinomadura macrotermitis]|uniref:Membrane-associated oxidoreductase n=1 Tax=Actinomadura macrotermitis TaxID=2585200 RepID=A0A7K0BVL5_9ACTN|nr:membrane-associated oxidoreductase [Actinomadura macrotermitis]MQY04724.1 hypothetical protein [Actinomadura macrotermitis]